jgi:glycine betaine/proline transport system ATP-binding protein
MRMNCRAACSSASGLARAFATEAPILLMDEPFSALDPLIRTKLQDELLELQKRLKKTIVFVSHDLEEALKIGNRITIMEGGRIVQSGTPEDIVLKPANDYVREFIANVNPLSVLTAWNVMRSGMIWKAAAKAGSGSTGARRRASSWTRTDLSSPPNATASRRVWISCDDIESLPDDAPHVFWARPGTSLKTVMLAIHRSQASPVALFDEQSRFVGAIGVRDVLSAVLRR